MDGIFVLYFCAFSECQTQGAKSYSEEVKRRKRGTKEGHPRSVSATCPGLSLWHWRLELLRLLAVYFESLVVKTLKHPYIA